MAGELLCHPRSLHPCPPLEKATDELVLNADVCGNIAKENIFKVIQENCKWNRVAELAYLGYAKMGEEHLGKPEDWSSVPNQNVLYVHLFVAFWKHSGTSYFFLK